jgi:endoglucanase
VIRLFVGALHSVQLRWLVVGLLGVLANVFVFDAAAVDFSGPLPFPQAIRSRWLIPPVDSQANLNRECLRGWETILKKLVVTDGCGPDEMRLVVDVSDFGGSIRPTYSEGIGWGMLFAAIMDRPDHSTQPVFDALDAYRKRHLTPAGFMNWRILANGETGSPGVAVEAEENIAMALLIAHIQWGSSGRTDYLGQFRQLSSALFEDCLLPDKNLLKPGDTWGGKDLLHPANWKLAYWRTWEIAVPEPRWSPVRKATGGLIQRLTETSPTGLPPHWCREDGSATKSAKPYFADYTFDYDAIQLPIHNALEVAWFGPEEASEAAEMNAKITRWANANAEAAPSRIRDGYTLDGKTIGKYRSAAFVTSFMLAAASSEDNRAYAKECFDLLVKGGPGDDTYYQAIIRLYGLLVASGNFPDIPAWLQSHPLPHEILKPALAQ